MIETERMAIDKQELIQSLITSQLNLILLTPCLPLPLKLSILPYQFRVPWAGQRCSLLAIQKYYMKDQKKVNCSGHACVLREFVKVMSKKF